MCVRRQIMLFFNFLSWYEKKQPQELLYEQVFLEISQK